MSSTRSRIFWLVVAATLFAAVMRFAGLLSLPLQAWVDEIWFALRAREVLQSGEFPIFYKTFWGGVNPMQVWLTAGVQGLGFDQLIVSSRLVSATFSVLSVPLAFACFREMGQFLPPPSGEGSRPVGAALSALVLAGFFSVIVLSRLGTEPAVALAASLFCVWQMKRGERTGCWLPFVLAGFGAGWAQYISPHARFILPLLALLGAQRLWQTRDSRRRQLFTSYLLLALVAVAVTAPLIAFFVREPEWFVGRARAVTVGAQQDLAQFLLGNVRAVVLSFSLIGDPNLHDNLAGRPWLDGLQSIGFYLGGLWALRHWRSVYARELLLWLGVMVVPVLLTDNAPSFSRLILAAPPAAALIVAGWAMLWEWVASRWSPRGVVAAIIVSVWIGTSLFLNGYDYFGRYAAQMAQPGALPNTPVSLARLLTSRAETESVLVGQRPDPNDDLYAFAFTFPGTGVERLDFRQCLPLVDQAPARTSYLIESDADALSVPELRRAFPAAAVTVFPPEPEALMQQWTLVEVAAGTRAPALAISADVQFGPGLRLLGYEISNAEAGPSDSVLFTLYWKAEAPLPEDVTAFLHVGTGLADSRFLVGRDGPPCQGFYPTSRWRVGQVVPDRFAVIIPPDAPPGRYPIAVGWYRFPSLQRLPLLAAAESLADNRAIIGALTVR